MRNPYPRRAFFSFVVVGAMGLVLLRTGEPAAAEPQPIAPIEAVCQLDSTPCQ